MIPSRDNQWLDHRLRQLWRQHFSDIPEITPVQVSFGRPTYRRLGYIILSHRLANGQKQDYSKIVLSLLLSRDDIPEFVIDQVLAHEMVHYLHGFGSHHKRTLRHPHQGGVITKELQKRGLWELYRVYQAWMKLHWTPIVHQYLNRHTDSKLSPADFSPEPD